MKLKQTNLYTFKLYTMLCWVVYNDKESTVYYYSEGKYTTPCCEIRLFNWLDANLYSICTERVQGVDLLDQSCGCQINHKGGFGQLYLLHSEAPQVDLFMVSVR